MKTSLLQKKVLFFASFLACTALYSYAKETEKLSATTVKATKLVKPANQKLGKKVAATVLKEKKKDECKPTSFQGHYGDFTVSFGGKLVQESYADWRKEFLRTYSNDPKSSITSAQKEALMSDSSLYGRSTADFSLRILRGEVKDPRIEMKQTFRLRNVFGGSGTVNASATDVPLGDATLQTGKPNLTKHLWWTRESWIKVALDKKDGDFVSFAQIGLIPYEVGRGISLGNAYQASGFIGLQGGFAVDQYAPAILFHTDVIHDKVDLDLYFALTENLSDNFKNNNAKIRTQEIENGNQPSNRGPLTQNYIFALAPKYTPWNSDANVTTLQPYWVYYHAPDQKSEFSADSNVYLNTIGLSAEQKNAHFEWGAEAAFNTGNQKIKAWDRNEIVIAVNDNGQIEQRYTKVFDNAGNPAVVTRDNKEDVQKADRSVSLNGADIPGLNNLENAIDRFRPAQERKYSGFFALGDFGYTLKKDNLKLFGSAGYVSGDLDDKRDISTMSSNDLKNQEYKGFLPIQSVYTGKRVSHFVFLNTGIPRFTQKDPRASTAGQNTTVGNASDSTFKNEFTNLVYVGGALEWKPKKLAHKKAYMKFNAVSYGMPSRTVTEKGVTASGYLGTELNLEGSIMLVDNLKLFTYGGVMVPGKHYKDMKDTPIGKGLVGDNLAFVLNMGIKFEF